MNNGQYPTGARNLEPRTPVTSTVRHTPPATQAPVLSRWMHPGADADAAGDEESADDQT